MGVLTGFVAILLTSCRPLNLVFRPFPDLHFKVDSVLVGRVFEEGAFAFLLPNGWEDTRFDSAAVLTEGTPGSAGFVLSRYFRNNRTEATLTVWHSAVAAGDTAVFSKRAVEFLELVRSRIPHASFSADWFEVNGVHVVQVAFPEKSAVELRYLFDGPTEVRLDFSVPVNLWKRESAAVRSTVGSVRYRTESHSVRSTMVE